MLRWPLATLALILTAPLFAETYFYIADHETGKVIKIKPDGTLVWDAPNGNGDDVRSWPTRHPHHPRQRRRGSRAGQEVVWSVGKPIVTSRGIGAAARQRQMHSSPTMADEGHQVDKDKKLVSEFDVPTDNRARPATMPAVEARQRQHAHLRRPRTRCYRFHRKEDRPWSRGRAVSVSGHGVCERQRR